MGVVFLYALFIVAEIGLLVAAVSIVAWMSAFVLSMYLDVPFVPTPHSAAKKIATALHLRPGDVVYELGSGSGHLLISWAREVPEARFVGIERNPLIHAYALINTRLNGNPPNVSLRRGNFFTADLRGATKVYAYLLPEVLEVLVPKLQREIPGARFASRAFTFKDKQVLEVAELSKTVGNHGQQLVHVYTI